MASRAKQIQAETNPILTNFAIGYRTPKMIARLVAPVVKSLTESGTLFSFGKDGFRLYSSERALRAATKQVDFAYSKDTYRCVEHALEAPLDYKELEAAEKYGAEKVLQLEKRTVFGVQRLLDLELENAVASSVFSGTYYATGNKVTLSGTDQWSDYTNSDPISDITTGRAAARADMGIYPNVLVLGAAVMEKLRWHPQILELIKYSQRGVVTEDILAALLAFDKVIVGQSVYAADDGTITDLWGKKAALVYVPMDEQMNVMDEMIEGTTPHTVIIEEEGYPQVKTYDQKKTRDYETTQKYQVKNVDTGFGYLVDAAVA